ncbi:hypothetical protein G3480_02970 [Thiorhodococcus mannitoliphagus]|uniref:Uncharacterized protein n=1 Tax=Thiorhodococcus mannitoliphagus TaxID=329406 RepID=A0A6P1DUB2_9GAMM|nr:hypothetical protein [Thiorhodococcus mannitoliphagus]NEX19284.1 hypothetical protein [Thiorhodococcus mannitoliphagus]
MHNDRHSRPWLEDFARALIHKGTDARRLLEADFDGWSHTGDESAEGPSRLEARIRSLFSGFAAATFTNPALNGSLLARDRRWG